MTLAPEKEGAARLSSRGRHSRNRFIRRRSQWRKVIRSTARLQAAQKASRLNSAQNIHSARSNSAPVSTIAPRPSTFTIARVLLPLASARRASFATSFGCSAIFRPSSAPRMPARDCTLAEIADELDQPLARLHLEQTHQRRADMPARRAAFDHRQARTRRRRKPAAGIKPRRHRDACAGETEHQRVHLLAAQSAPAFAHHVADIAEHEQIAGQHAGRARDILRLAGDEAARKACGLARRLAASRSADLVFAISAGAPRLGARRRDRQSCAQARHHPRRARLDLARRNRSIEALVERQLGEPHRIVLRRDRARGVHAFGQAERRRERQAGGDPKRERDGETGKQVCPQPDARLI